jgi:hypothetical protein
MYEKETRECLMVLTAGAREQAQMHNGKAASLGGKHKAAEWGLGITAYLEYLRL